MKYFLKDKQVQKYLNKKNNKFTLKKDFSPVLVINLHLKSSIDEALINLSVNDENNNKARSIHRNPMWSQDKSFWSKTQKK